MVNFNLETCRYMLSKARDMGYIILSPYDGYNVSPLSLFVLYGFSTRTISDMTEGRLREPELRKLIYNIIESIIRKHPEIED